MKQIKNSVLVFSLILVTLVSCSDSDDNLYEDSVCDQITIVDNNIYNSTQTDGFSITNIELAGDCLEVEILSSGCSGDTWKVNLIDAGRVAESNPEQRDVKISLDNQEDCEAIITKTYTFDLRPIRTQSNVVLLNLELWDEQIHYDY